MEPGCVNEKSTNSLNDLWQMCMHYILFYSKNFNLYETVPTYALSLISEKIKMSI